MPATTKQAKDLASAKRAAVLRQIPSVDELIGTQEAQQLIARAGRPLVLSAIRELLADLRKNAGNGAAASFDATRIMQDVARNVEITLSPSLHAVINATGVVLHTNLGRAPLARAAVERIAATAAGYSNLEYDVAAGKRGKRDAHTSRLLAELAGAEAAIVVNNNAAAVFLVLNTLAKGAEVIVSRGEMIEIGDGFR